MTTPLDDMLDTPYMPSTDELRDAKIFADGLEWCSGNSTAKHIVTHINTSDVIPLARIIRAGIEVLSNE